MLYVTNEDKPGFIGRLGTVLGDAGINIATFHLGRASAGDDAICLVEVDGPIPAEVAARVKAIPGVRQATDRKSVVEGKRVSVRVDLGGRCIIKKKQNNKIP